MRRFRHLALRCLALISLFCAAEKIALAAKDVPKPPVERWDEARPGCTFSRTPDGKYHYGLWFDNVVISVAVDSQELEKVRRRHEPFFGVLLSVRYRGPGALEVSAENASLEFVKHFQVMQSSLDPDDFSARVQNDADELDHQTAREIEKHPEQKESKELYMRAFQKDAAELLEFVSKNSLRPARLSPADAEINGWVLFSTRSKWIGGWKKQEEFIFRLPLAEKIFEFPFRLPPREGELTLRRRE